MNLLDTSAIRGDWGWLTYPAHGVSDGQWGYCCPSVNREALTPRSYHQAGQRKQRPQEVKGLTQGCTAVRDRAADFLNLAHADFWNSRTKSGAGSPFFQSEA